MHSATRPHPVSSCRHSTSNRSCSIRSRRYAGNDDSYTAAFVLSADKVAIYFAGGPATSSVTVADQITTWSVTFANLFANDLHPVAPVMASQPDASVRRSLLGVGATLAVPAGDRRWPRSRPRSSIASTESSSESCSMTS